MNDDDLFRVSKLYAASLALTKTIEEGIAAMPAKVVKGVDSLRSELSSFAASKALTSILIPLPPKIKVQRLCPEATVPTRSMESAGYDLYAVEDIEVISGSVIKVKTGIAIELPPGYAGLIWPRSGLGSKGLTVLGGVVDQDYRGEVCVLLTTLTSPVYPIRAGERVAQILIQPVVQLGLEEVESLGSSARGKTGFGSTGA